MINIGISMRLSLADSYNERRDSIARDWLKYIQAEFEDCNFLLIEAGSNLNFSAEEIYEFLCSKGLIVRQMKEYNLSDYLRITIGTEEANKLVISSLEELLK